MLWWTLRQLRSENVIQRIEAIRKLSAHNEPETVSALVDMLDDPAESVEKEAKKALGRVGTASVAALLSALHHPSDRRRLGAASALRTIIPDWPCREQSSEVVATLVSAMAHEDPAYRRMAARELGYLQIPVAMRTLASALCDSDAEVRQSAREGLQKMLAAADTQAPGDGGARSALALDVIPVLIGAMCKHRPSSAEYETAGFVLVQAGRAAVEPLLGMLASPTDGPTRLAVVDALGFIGDAKALKPLVSFLKDPSPALRLSAARALGRFESEAAADALVAALKDSDVNVRMAAAQSLLQIESESRLSVAIPGLLGALRDKSPLIRRNAASLLAAICDPRSAGGLLMALADRDDEVRATAAAALTKIGMSAADSLRAALDDRNDEVRRQVVQIMGRIDGREFVEPLLGALKDGSAAVRIAAIKVLQSLCDRRAGPAFVRALADPSPAVRAGAAGALAAIGNEHAVRPLIVASKQAEGTRECRDALVAIMALHAADVDPEDLRTLAEFTAQSQSAPDSTAPAVTSEAEMNCSALRQLAREELAHRGIRL